MLRRGVIAGIALSALAMVAWAANEAADVASVTLQGIVVDEAGKPVRGATVTAFDNAEKMSVSVYSKEDGTFRIAGLDAKDYTLRARLLGMDDTSESVSATKTSDHKLVMNRAKDLNMQRPANDRLDLLKFEDEKDATNFRMMCVYCHQVGTEGFRSPEEPVDWEVMVTRMDGFRGLYEHTQKNLVDKLLETYGVGAEEKWPAYTPPEAPKGEALKAEVSEWQMGKENDAMIHDLEVGIDGKVYTVDMTADAMEVLDPVTGKREIFSIPGGKAYDSTDAPIKGPHSVEVAPNGDLWLTLALSGEMAKFDPKTKQYSVFPGAQAPRKRGGYPHTLRVDNTGSKVWWTDAASPGSMGVASIDTKTFEVKQYKLPDANQVKGGGAGGESAGVTPYGLSVAPDGKIWYTKLNGERVGRVDPSKAGRRSAADRRVGAAGQGSPPSRGRSRWSGVGARLGQRRHRVVQREDRGVEGLQAASRPELDAVRPERSPQDRRGLGERHRQRHHDPLQSQDRDLHRVPDAHARDLHA